MFHEEHPIGEENTREGGVRDISETCTSKTDKLSILDILRVRNHVSSMSHFFKNPNETCRDIERDITKPNIHAGSSIRFYNLGSRGQCKYEF